jgi:AcrR family transcriptional regulator
MLAAAEQLVCARGAEPLTVTALTAAAHVSRTTFYATFADREDCLLALFDELIDRLRASMLAASSAQMSWLDGVRAALCVLLAWLDQNPRLARFLIVGGISGDSALVARRRRVLADLAGALEADSPQRDGETAPVPFGAEALVGGAASILHSRLVEDPIPSLRDLSGSLMAVLVLPFVGEGVARGELARATAVNEPRRKPSPRVPAGSTVSARRLGRRTVAVLSVIADDAPITNRSVARKAGGIDEGQASRLLARLAGLGLIASERPRADHGSANAWRLTRAGADLLASLSSGHNS